MRLARLAGSPGSTGSARQAVSDSYTAWATAVAHKDGDAAADRLSTSSLTYFDGIRTAALDDDRKALSARTAVDQLTVLSFRANLPAGLLRTGSVHDVVSSGVTKGVISPGSSVQAGFSQVAVDGDRASGVLKIVGDTTQSYRVGLVRERGTWKFDLTSLLPVGEASWRRCNDPRG